MIELNFLYRCTDCGSNCGVGSYKYEGRDLDLCPDCVKNYGEEVVSEEEE